MLAAVIEAVGGGGAMTVIRIPDVGWHASPGGTIGVVVPAVTRKEPLEACGDDGPNIVSRLATVVNEPDAGIVKTVELMLASYLIMYSTPACPFWIVALNEP